MAELSSIYVDIYRIEISRKKEEKILSDTLNELINSDKFTKLKQEVFALYSETCYIKKVPVFLQPLFVILSNRFFQCTFNTRMCIIAENKQNSKQNRPSKIRTK